MTVGNVSETRTQVLNLIPEKSIKQVKLVDNAFTRALRSCKCFL